MFKLKFQLLIPDCGLAMFDDWKSIVGLWSMRFSQHGLGGNNERNQRPHQNLL